MDNAEPPTEQLTVEVAVGRHGNVVVAYLDDNVSSDQPHREVATPGRMTNRVGDQFAANHERGLDHRWLAVPTEDPLDRSARPRRGAGRSWQLDVQRPR